MIPPCIFELLVEKLLLFRLTALPPLPPEPPPPLPPLPPQPPPPPAVAVPLVPSPLFSSPAPPDHQRFDVDELPPPPPSPGYILPPPPPHLLMQFVFSYINFNAFHNCVSLRLRIHLHQSHLHHLLFSADPSTESIVLLQFLFLPAVSLPPPPLRLLLPEPPFPPPAPPALHQKLLFITTISILSLHHPPLPEPPPPSATCYSKLSDLIVPFCYITLKIKCVSST